MSDTRSPHDVSEVNHGRLCAYLGKLRDGGLRLPAYGGVVNKTAVARACGFARETFQQNRRFAATLEAGVAELGLEADAVAERPVRDGEDKARILQLEQQLAVSRGEVLELRRKLKRYEAIAEHVAATGRRVLP